MDTKKILSLSKRFSKIYNGSVCIQEEVWAYKHGVVQVIYKVYIDKVGIEIFHSIQQMKSYLDTMEADHVSKMDEMAKGNR
jgi:hypothetical protein